MGKNKPKKVTIEKLAMMVANGFNEVNEKMDKGFNDLERKLKKEIVDTKNELKTELNKKVDKYTYKGLEIQVEKLQQKVEVISKK